MTITLLDRIDSYLENGGYVDDTLMRNCRDATRQRDSLRDALQRILNYPVHSEPVGGAMAMQEIASAALGAGAEPATPTPSEMCEHCGGQGARAVGSATG